MTAQADGVLVVTPAAEPAASGYVEQANLGEMALEASDRAPVRLTRRVEPAPTKRRRGEELRRGKRAQRQRERAAGLVHVGLTLPRAQAQKLRVAAADPAFTGMLDELVVRVDDYAALREIAWNRVDELIPARKPSRSTSEAGGS